MKGMLLELFTVPLLLQGEKRIAEKVAKQLSNVLLVHKDVSVPENAELARKRHE